MRKTSLALAVAASTLGLGYRRGWAIHVCKQVFPFSKGKETHL